MNWAVLLLFVAASACSSGGGNYEFEAGQLRTINGDAPKDMRMAVVKIAHECRVPVSSVALFHNMEQWIKQEWVIELSHTQAATPAVTSCVERKINSLGLASVFTWGELPPPPPQGWRPKESYLLMAAERHVDDPANVPPIPKARALLRKALKDCGIDEFHEREITDGIFALEFAMLPKDRTDRLSCVQREQPRGAWVEPAH